MKVESTNRFWMAMFGMSILSGCLAMVGFFAGQQSSSAVIEIPVDATGSAFTESMAAATGTIDGDMEGLFTLDSLTGDLQCVVLNSRNGKFTNIFRTNVLADLELEPTKKPNFMLVTGRAVFRGGSGNVQPANTAAYVIDATSGKFVAYGVPWDRAAASRNTVQTNKLLRLDVGTARDAAIRN